MGEKEIATWTCNKIETVEVALI